MSSINKSGKRFTPKLTQRGRKGLVTPQSSQVTTTSQRDISPTRVVSPSPPISPVSQKTVATPTTTTTTTTTPALRTASLSSSIPITNNTNKIRTASLSTNNTNTSTTSLRRPSYQFTAPTPNSRTGGRKRLNSLSSNTMPRRASLSLVARRESQSLGQGQGQGQGQLRDQIPIQTQQEIKKIPIVSKKVNVPIIIKQREKEEVKVKIPIKDTEIDPLVKPDIEPKEVVDEVENVVETVPEPTQPIEAFITEAELAKNSKWVLNRETRRYELVKIEDIKDNTSAAERYEIGHKLENILEIQKIFKDSDSTLTSSIEINENKMTMRDLCKPSFPIGKTSKNFEAAIAGERKLAEERINRRKIRERAKRLRMSEDKVIRVFGDEGFEEMNEKERLAKVKEMMDKKEEVEKHNVVQLQISDGKLTYNQESTVVDRHIGRNEQNKEVVEENIFEHIVTSETYTKRKVTSKWSPHEVAELFKAVSIFGTDFEMIAKLFPYRTRKQIKAKFLLEEKKRPHLVEFALLRKLPVNFEEFSGKSGFKFNELSEYEKEIENLREKHNEELKLMEIERVKAQIEDSGVNKVKKSRKTILAEFRKNEEVVGTID